MAGPWSNDVLPTQPEETYTEKKGTEGGHGWRLIPGVVGRRLQLQRRANPRCVKRRWRISGSPDVDPA
jgi:hypothetical protein